LKLTLRDALIAGNFKDLNFIDEKITLGNEPKDKLSAQFEMMIKIRLVEDKIALMRREGYIGGPVHLGAGQEAIAVGVSTHLRKSDRVFSAHRSHAHLLALGSDVRRLFAELLGKSNGLTHGMGGSMHLWDQPNGFYGSVPIVAGTVPLAVGTGLAAKIQGKTDIAVAYFGDGAVEEGVVHESLNLASHFNIPILFVCENNFFSSHMHISQRQSSQLMSRFAVANNISSEVIDGNNIIEVSNIAHAQIKNIRGGKGPQFLEVVTFRHYGHVDWREDIDVGVHRSAEDLAKWKKFDPIKRLEFALIAEKFMSEDEISTIYLKLMDEIQAAWKLAENDPIPNSKDLLSFVYRGN
jgi:pyruvate dehydrogenase E1 component alpha subunit